MARPIPATPTVTGEAAKKLLHEIIHGTPNTPQRIETMKRADEIYRKHLACPCCGSLKHS